MTSAAIIDQLFHSAWTAQTTGGTSEAISLYYQILGNGENGAAWLGIGQCLLENRQPTEALVAFRRAAALLPESGAVRHMVAMLEGGEAPDRAPDDYVLWVFDGHAEQFDAHLARLGYRGPQMIAALIEGIWERKSTRRILDLGCGTGLNAPLFRSYASSLDGVDLAPRMLQQAARRSYDRLYKAEAHVFLQRPPSRYDVLLSTDVFIYIGHLERIFSLSYQILDEGGELLCTIELGEKGASAVQLMPTGRFRQTDSYLRFCAEQAGFHVAGWRDDVLRVEKNAAVSGRAYRLTRV